MGKLETLILCMSQVRIGFIPGVWDLLHHGHLNVINTAKSHCDYLVVGVCCDKLVEESKNKPPIVSDIHREHLLKNLKAVNDTFIYHDFEYHRVVERFGANVIFVGGEFGENEIQQKFLSYCKEEELPVYVIPRTQGISSTNIKETIKEKL
jgi:glycerol-3-phosphate cytidylyltransferase